MSALSDYLEAKYLDIVYNGEAFTPPAALYIALYTTDPTDADTGTEVSGGGYARAPVNPNGGAIAMGHPLGMSGARITLTLANELKRRGGGVGAAALCGGGGQGDALIIRVPATA